MSAGRLRLSTAISWSAGRGPRWRRRRLIPLGLRPCICVDVGLPAACLGANAVCAFPCRFPPLLHKTALPHVTLAQTSESPKLIVLGSPSRRSAEGRDVGRRAEPDCFAERRDQLEGARLPCEIVNPHQADRTSGRGVAWPPGRVRPQSTTAAAQGRSAGPRRSPAARASAPGHPPFLGDCDSPGDPIEQGMLEIGHRLVAMVACPCRVVQGES